MENVARQVGKWGRANTPEAQDRAADLRDRAAAPRRRAVQQRMTQVAVGAQSWKQAVGVLAGGILLGVGLVRLIDVLTRPLLLLLLSITLAATLAPPVRVLDRRLPRPAAVSIVYLVVVGILVLIAWLIAPSVAQQGQQLIERAPQVVADLQQRFQSVLPRGVQLEEAVSAVTQNLGNMPASIVYSTVSGAFQILVVIFLSAYFLMAAPRFHRFAVSLSVGSNRRRTSRVLLRMSHAMGGYFRGALIDGVIIGVLTWITLMLIGRPFAAPLGVIAAIGELIPYIGPIAAAVPAIALALLDSPQQALIVALAYLAIQQIEGHLVTPLVMHSQTDITPGTVLFAVVSGFAVAGILGAIAAVPLFAAARVLVLWVVLPRIRCVARRRAAAMPAA